MNFVSRNTIVKKLLESKKFRDSYVSENIKRIIPFNLRTMRDEREWSQHEAGQAIGKPQNVISRLESPAYGKLTLQTLLEIAHGYDVGLLIKFVPFSRLIKEYEDVSAQALSAKSVSDEEEASALKEWAVDDDIGDIQDALESTPARVFKVINSPATTPVQGRLPFDRPSLAYVNETPSRQVAETQFTSSSNARMFKRA